MAQEAFDLAEHFQTRCLSVGPGPGMNNWMSDPFPYPEKPIDRGKVLEEELVKAADFSRYKDIGLGRHGYRTLPRTESSGGGWFARGSGHNERRNIASGPDDFERNMERINKKFATGHARLSHGPELEGSGKAKVGILLSATSHWASLSRAINYQGTRVGDRLSAVAFVPFTREVARIH